MATAGPQLTEEQRSAILARDVSVSLSAGAGCGKTFVLTERFLSHLVPEEGKQSPADRLSRLVAITFSDRAAREMRSRIRRHCHQRLADAVGRHDQRQWLELLRQLDTARVSTIHSFCSSLLRSCAVDAGLDPQFAILDQPKSQRIATETIEEVLRRRLAAHDETVLDLVHGFGLTSLRELIRRMLAVRHDIDFDAWSRRTADELVPCWRDLQDRIVAPTAARRLGRSLEARRILDLIRRHPPVHGKMIERCAVLLDLLPRLDSSDAPLDDIASIRANATVQHVHKSKGWPDPTTQDQFKSAAESLRQLFDRQLGKLGLDEPSAQMAAKAGLQLLDVTSSVTQAYTARKMELGLLDHDDLLIRARDLLCRQDESVRQRVARQIDMLLVDEFQDTDRLQVELVKALCGSALADGKLFFVGDQKQSIYRFRGAEPEVFRDLRAAVPAAGRLPLSENFRSQPAILQFVNALFCDELGPDYEPLVPSKTQVTATPAVEFMWAVVGKSDSATARSIEADWIARRLKAMLAGDEPLVSETVDGQSRARAVRQGDIALLFRAMTDVHHYEAALESRGIDYYVVGGHAFYAQQEVFDLLNLLRAVGDRHDEVSLAGALRSPLFGLTDESLFWLACHEHGLAAAVASGQWPATLEGEQRRRAAVAAETIDRLRSLKDRLPIIDFLNEVLARTGYDATLLGEFLGTRKLANLYKLLEQARGFDASGIFTLADFVAQLADAVAEQPLEAPAATQAENADVVRLMSIHQAKGLEFPVVVVPDLDRPMMGSRSPVAFASEWGPLVRPRHAESTVGLDLYRVLEDAEDEAERTRLLYVATTRAADYLLLSSSLKAADKFGSPWMRLLADRFDLATGSLLAPLPDGYAAPAVKVTKEQPPEPAREPSESHRRRLSELLSAAEAWPDDTTERPPSTVLPIAPDRAARRRFSFSALSGELHQSDSDSTRFDILDSPVAAPAYDPLRFGTLVHDVLESASFAHENDLPSLVRRHAQSQPGCTSEEIEEALDLVSRFLASARADALANAQQVHRELEFLLGWPPDDVQAEGVYMEGFIDCLYQDAAGRWHVLDYKTNRTTAADLSATAAPYELQMHVYALATQQVLGVLPATLTLYFLRPGLEYQFDWNGDARRRTIERLNELFAGTISHRSSESSAAP